MLNQSRKNVDLNVYCPRNPQNSDYFQCVQDNFEELQNVWDDRFASRYGYWRPYVMDVIYRYLECGDLHCGFARVRCDHCGHEYLLSYSCKRRHFCPSCHQKRVVEYGEWLLLNVLKNVPHRQWVFSIPKRLRIYFLFDRKLLGKLSICAWKVIRTYFEHAVPYSGIVPGASIVVQSYGDFLNFNPHLHAIVADGGFFDDNDKKLMNAVHDTEPQLLGAESWNFTDKRLQEMLFRYRARNYPETLDSDEQAEWLEHCRARLIEGESGHLTFKDFHAEIEQLRSEMEADAQKMSLLDEVAAFGTELEALVQSE